MNMRAALIPALIALSSGLVGLLHAGETPFSVSIRPQQESVLALHEIFLDITVTNTSGKLFTLVDYPPQVVYTVEVAGPDGQRRPLTRIGEQIVKNAPVEMASHGALVDTRGYLEVHLLPGQTFKQVIRIDDLFEIKTPGVYSVKLRRKIPDDLGEGEVASNTVTINVRYNPVVEEYPPALRPK